MTTRDRILDAAAHVMRTQGLARATTKEIAKAAGLSEAALYKHFRDKTDLFLSVLRERAPSDLMPVLTDLDRHIGQGTARDTLERVARAAITFYQHSFPIGASLFSDPPLLQAHRTALRERCTGPQHVNQALANYLAAEQRAGGIHPDVDPAAVAGLLLGACFQYAFLSHFVENQPGATGDRLARDLVRALMTGLTPPGARVVGPRLHNGTP